MEWTFDKDNNGFIANQLVKINKQFLNRDHFLVCQSMQSKSTPGIRQSDIVLPSGRYYMEVDGFANNKKSFLWIIDSRGLKLTNGYTCLPGDVW